ncbi:hypothetical protein [Neobacillus citreus]|uniref:Uncharacterized protein n=1 Tax=Neobacillus citreus TaxID=2833578 RepID=A0A942T500_9BACI|nr:hypothetical protein [Neobacillus citreus]MCH6269365.1 hypothetical protein [Neobacillus citreus]
MMTNRRAVDHGIQVNAEESRTAAICINRAGEERLVIAAKGFVLIIDPETEETRQLFFPEQHIDYPFASYSSEDGLFYTGAGNMLMVIDPFKGEFFDYQWIENGEEIVGFSFAEDCSGQIYFSSYPSCHLLQYCPKTKTIHDHGQMDKTEKYPASTAVDRHGWVYLGIGTERKNIVAFHPDTKERKTLVPPTERTRGAGYVYQGKDGNVYGHWEASDLKDVNKSLIWYEFFAGGCSLTSHAADSRYSGEGFNRIHRNGEGCWRVLEHRMAEGFLFIKKQQDSAKKITLQYQSEGAALSTLISADNRYIYGTSMHPMQLFRYEVTAQQATNFGGAVLEKGGGGNIPAYAVQGTRLIGFAYAGGKIYEINLEKPIQHLENSRNPRLISEHLDIHRPRCAAAHPDGSHIVWGGFPGYGMTGGGLGIYLVDSRTNTVLPHTSVVPNQSTVCLGVLRSGDIVGGTSIETPGGASTKEQEGKLFLFDWTKQEVGFRISPIPGSKEISQLFVDVRDLVHGLTIEGIYFVFDPQSRKVLFQKDFSGYGAPVRTGFVGSTEQPALYGLLNQAIIKIEITGPEPREPEVHALLANRATSGMVYHDGWIYYGSGSHLMSIKVES